MADDESFLYGEGDESQDDVQDRAEAPSTDYDEESNSNLPPLSGQEENSGEGVEEVNVPEDPVELDEEDDEDDSDDDDIKITIDRDKIDEAKTTYQTFGLNKAVRQPPSEKKGKFSVEEFDQVGTINGADAQEFDFDSMEEKPWRKPGADITDYFNYGFTEDTWQAYCNRQRKMRMNESGAGMPGLLNTINTKPVLGGSIPTVGVPKRLPTVMHRSIPPPGVLSEGSPSQTTNLVPAPIAVMTSDKREFSKKIIETMDFSVPPPGIPPPGMPPTSVPPPTFDGPPPNPMGDFPADDPFGQDYDYYPAYEPTMESQWAAPPSSLSGPPPGDAPPGDPTYEERHGERDVWRERGAAPSVGGRRSSRDERERDRYEQRDRDRKRRRSRSRSRERYREYRERDRDRERERVVEVKRERRSDRRERTKSQSPKSRSPSHSSSASRHKKSKKVKREKSDKPERDIKQEKEDE